jgi:YjbE family integral membrane protein
MPASHFLVAALTIILIDLLLAGDNALVIAMAVRTLPPRERRIGVICGAGLAVALRVILTLVAAAVLQFKFIQLAGGLFILWIALKVLIDANDPPKSVAAPGSLWKAIWYVLVADLTMSVDNILAIAGASRGHLGLIIFGLAVSIPFVIFSSNLLANLMNKYPLLIWFGAALLAKVGGDMILSDPFIEERFHPPALARYAVDAALIAALLIAGKLLCGGKSKNC